MSVALTWEQRRAIQRIAARPAPRLLEDRARGHLQRWRRGEPGLSVTIGELLTINFHPDRPVHGCETVLESISRNGRLQNQFENSMTSGFTLAWRAGLRARREEALFGGAYDAAQPSDRPKYGAINLLGNPRGGWPRFGSCHWLLRASLLPRCTVTVPGSHNSKAWWGTPEKLAALLDQSGRSSDGTQPDNHRYRLIDGPVELHIHGEVLLGRDVKGLVLDPSFRGSIVESAAARLAATFGIVVSWAPKLQSGANEWQIPPTRRHARARVRGARNAEEPITAAWIGRDVWDDGSDTTSKATAEGASRYLWNRLLLTQHH